MRLKSRSWLRVLATIAILTATIGLHKGLESLVGAQLHFVVAFPAVLLVTLLAGRSIGIASACILILFWWIDISVGPLNPMAWSRLHAASFVLVLGSALAIVWAASSLQMARDRLQKAQERLIAALSASGTGTWRWDVNADRVVWDEALAAVYGIDPAQAPTDVEGFKTLIHPDDREHAGRVIGEALATGGDAIYEFRAETPHGTRWIYDRSKVFRDRTGRPSYMIGACLDITDRKEAEQRQKLLIHELNHRVKNTLATVQSLARQTMRSHRDPQVFVEVLLARLQALAETHNILTRENWKGGYLEEVVRTELAPYCGEAPGGKLTLEGAPLWLNPRAVLALGLTFHELATNAAKYGALSAAEGRIEVSWTVEDDEPPRLVMTWQEQGGPAASEPESTGFGSRLIEHTITRDLEGGLTTRFGPGGITHEIVIPLSALSAEAREF